MNTIDTNPGTWYCFFCTAPAAVTAEIDGEYVTLAVLDSEGKEAFCAPAESISIETDGKFRVLPTKASAGTSGGGDFHSNLNVGHGASAAVAAVCTLTLGDPTAEGDLTDNAEHVLHLDAQPALQSRGVLTVADATEGGTLSIGGEVVEIFTEKKETPASISLALQVDVSELHGDYEFGLQYNGELWCSFTIYITSTTGEAFAEELGNAERWKLPDGTVLGFAPVEATWDSATEKIILVSTAKQGADGDNVAVEDRPTCPFVVPQDESNFSGGQDARTMEEALAYVEGVVNSCDGLEADVDAESNAVLVTASEAGAAGDLLTIGFEGDMLEVTEQMDGGQDARTYAEVIAEINGDDGVSDPTYPFGAKAEATETEGTITLTAAEAGADANAITYTATGCFGGGTVKQGSTTRGKNAVEQTDYEIILNGNQPRPLVGGENATAMKNGGVYTVAAAGAALNFSAVTIGVNATARIWLDYDNPTDVEWPHGWVWLTDDGTPPEFALFKRFKLEIENDAVATTAKVADSYPYALEYTHTELTSTNYADDELELFLVPGETENPVYTNNAWAMFNSSGRLGYYTANWVKGKNMLGEDLPVNVESAPPPPYPQFRWSVCTFRTSAPVDFAGLAASCFGGKAIHIALQAWNDGGWVTCGEAAVDVEKTDALHVVNHVTTDKWRLLISGEGETFVGKVKLFVNR